MRVAHRALYAKRILCKSIVSPLGNSEICANASDTKRIIRETVRSEHLKLSTLVL